MAARFLVERAIPGMAICVVRDGRVWYEGHYGLANVETGEPVDQQTVFDLGSIKKHVTAAAIVRLAERGKLSLDDPITRWLPQFPPQLSAVRLHHMLNQVSGLPDEATGTDPFALDFEPGTSWAYSNANFDDLDLVIEAADGRSFARYLREEFAEPLGLDTLAKCDENLPAAGNVAHAYTVRDGVVVPRADPACWFRGSARDLATWMDALMRGEVVSRAGVQAMTTPARLVDGRESPYGFGLDLRPYPSGSASTSAQGPPVRLPSRWTPSAFAGAG